MTIEKLSESGRFCGARETILFFNQFYSVSRRNEYLIHIDRARVARYGHLYLQGSLIHIHSFKCIYENRCIAGRLGFDLLLFAASYFAVIGQG